MRVHRNCCGLDVHKKMIAACLLREDAEGNSVTEKRLFGSMTRELHELAQWLCAAQVTAVAMEATGVYWMPVWNVLEPYGLQLLLINPEHYKAVRGKKTDLKDGTRIAELLQDGRLEGSYVPPVDIRVLRDLTRYRIKLVQYQSSIANRIQKFARAMQHQTGIGRQRRPGRQCDGYAARAGAGRNGCGANGRHGQKASAEEYPRVAACAGRLFVAASSFTAQRNARGSRPCGRQDHAYRRNHRATDAAVSERSQSVADRSGHQTSSGLEAGRRSWSHGRSISVCC